METSPEYFGKCSLNISYPVPLSEVLISSQNEGEQICWEHIWGCWWPGWASRNTSPKEMWALLCRVPSAFAFPFFLRTGGLANLEIKKSTKIHVHLRVWKMPFLLPSTSCPCSVIEEESEDGGVFLALAWSCCSGMSHRSSLPPRSS